MVPPSLTTDEVMVIVQPDMCTGAGKLTTLSRTSRVVHEEGATIILVKAFVIFLSVLVSS